MNDIVDVAIEIAENSIAGLSVQRVECHERLFETYEVTASALVEEPLEIDDMVGSSACVRLRAASHGERAWHGLVWSARLVPRQEGNYSLELSIRPRASLLTLGLDSRIFREMTVPEVVDEVFRRAGLASDAWAWELEEALPRHVNVTQYRESDYAFVRRLLAEEGVTFAVTNDGAKETLRLFDGAGGFSRREELASLSFGRVGEHGRGGVWDLRERFAVTTDAVTVRDYDPRRATRELVHSTGDDLERYVHPAGFVELREGRRRAERGRDALIWGRRRLAGTSNVPWLEAGCLVGIDGHERVDLAGTFGLVDVRHTCARQESDRGAWHYEASFESIPERTIHRPEPIRSRPLGLQRAFVTTPAGQDNHFDEEGEVKVRFPWDRSGVQDDRSSTWCRAGQMQLPGPMVLPRAGFSVLVTAEQDDLDRPLVIGHTYDAERGASYPTPIQSAISSWQSATLDSGPGVNELRFDDTAGAEELLWNASMTLRSVVENDSVRRVTRTENVLVGVWQSLSVTEDFVSAVGAARTTLIGHDQRIRAGENLSVSVGGDEQTSCQRRRRSVGADLVESTGQRLERNVGPIEVVGALASYSHRTVRDSTTTAGTLWAETVVGNKTSSVRGDRTETVSALRCIEAGSVRVRAAGGIDETFGSLELEVEGDRVESTQSSRVEVSGEMSWTATTVSIVGARQLSLTGGSCTITLEASGTVTLEGPRVNLRNAESLGSSVRVN